MSIAIAIIPIIIVVIVGYFLARTHLIPPENWKAIELLGFRVLIPAIIIHSIYTSDLSVSRVGPFIWTLLGAFFLAGALAFSFRIFTGVTRFSNPRFTTLFQTTTRWNAYIALAAGTQILGDGALVLISVAMAFIIPLINVINIIVLSTYGDARLSFSGIVLNVLKNPLVIGCIAGIFLNLSGVILPKQVLDGIEIISRGALAIGLLAIGAGIDFSRLFTASYALVVGVVMRIAVCPAIFVLLGRFYGLTNDQMVCGILVCSVPAATNGYIVAKQMGGDADLYACILTWQTVFAAASIPLFVGLSAYVPV
jgi:malonate transporter